MNARQRAVEIFNRYKRKYDGEVQGCCPVIASDIMREIGGEPVAGFLCFGGTKRQHWWVELNGEILDPMGDDIVSHEDFWEREEVHRNVDIFDGILPRYELWRV